MGGEGGLAAGSARAQTVCLVVHTHVVPDEAMTHAVLYGRDSRADYIFQFDTTRTSALSKPSSLLLHEKVGQNRTSNVFLIG